MLFWYVNAMHGATTTGASAKELPRGEGRANSSSGFALCLRGVGRATSTGALCMVSRNASLTGVLALQVTQVTRWQGTVLQQVVAATGSRETPLEAAACFCRFNAPSRGALSSFYMQFSCFLLYAYPFAQPSSSLLPLVGSLFPCFICIFGFCCNFLVSLF